MDSVSEVKAKILLISTVPSTLWAFFRRLPSFARERQMEVAVAAADMPELEYFQKQFGSTTHTIKLTRKISPLTDILAVLRLVQIIKRNKYDIIHAHTPKAGLVGMLAAWLAGVPNRVYTIHGFPAETATGLTRRLLVLAERIAVRAASHVLVVSKSLREQVISAGVAQETKLHILGDGTACGVNVERFTRSASTDKQAIHTREKLGIPADARLMGFVGRLVLDKGIDVIVDVFLQLCDTRPDLYLLLLGDYEPDRGCVPRRTIEIIENHPRIKHVAFDWDPIPYYAAMDVLVLASLREGFPYILLEAASLGIPTVSTRATGCVDAIVNEETGFLVDIGDVNAMVRTTGSFLDDDALCRTIGQAARDRVIRLFTDDRLLEEHIRLYESML